MSRSRVARAAVFYIALGAVVAAVLLQVLPVILPPSVADRIGHNSEGLVLALLVAAWIQYARPRLERVARAWPVVAFTAVGCLAVGLVLDLSDLPSRFRTLNETFFAAAVVVPYVQLRRPLPRWVPAVLAASVLAVVATGMRTQVVTDLAETLGVLLLVPIGFDLVDRCILEPGARRGAARYAWYAFLVLAPLAFSLLEYRVGVAGVAGEAVRYAVRIVEAFLFMLLVEVYFTVWAPPPAPSPTAADAVATPA